MKTLTFMSTIVVLFLAISVDGVVTEPPHAPSWWNNQDAPYWGYAYDTSFLISPPTECESNFDEFSAEIFQIGMTPTTILMTLGNVQREDFDKHYFFYAGGGNATGAPYDFTNAWSPGIDSLVVNRKAKGSYNPDTGEWGAYVEFTVHPQPHTVKFGFHVPSETGAIGYKWAAGEYCIPEPATIALLGLGGLTLLRRRRG